METAISAGCALAVSVSTSSGPSNIVAESFSPSAASTSSKTARASANCSARALPMPTAWLPCPGKVNATAMNASLDLTILRDVPQHRLKSQVIVGFSRLCGLQTRGKTRISRPFVAGISWGLNGGAVGSSTICWTVRGSLKCFCLPCLRSRLSLPSVLSSPVFRYKRSRRGLAVSVSMM